MSNAEICLSSAAQDWRTPENVLERVRRIDVIGLDPCGGEGSTVGAISEFRLPTTDGLVTPWNGHGLVFVNPPYGREISTWVKRAAYFGWQGGEACEVVLLVPARVGTNWWHENIAGACPGREAAAVCFWHGRLKFVPAPGRPASKADTATFDSALVYWGHRPWAFEAAMDGAGWTVRS